MARRGARRVNDEARHAAGPDDFHPERNPSPQAPLDEPGRARARAVADRLRSEPHETFVIAATVNAGVAVVLARVADQAVH